MVFAFTPSGVEVVTQAFVDSIDEVAVGDGDTTPEATDTSLDNELFRSTIGSVANVSQLSADTVQATITVVGADSVAADATVTEVGLFNDDQMVYRETITPIIVGAGQSVQLQTNLTVSELIAA